MDERAAALDLPPPHLDAAPSNRFADLQLLGLLVLLTVGLRAWQLTHTEVTARDSIGYIRIAWNLEHGDWLATVKNASQPPGYPLAIRAMSVFVRPVVADPARAMQLSAQLTSALASALLVVPLYYLGRELFARRVAFWGVLLFQCLPSSGRIMADGLSEPLFLLLASTSLALALAALRTRSVSFFALAGLASGAAYLTRPEGSVVALAAGLVLLCQQWSARWHRPWPVVLKCGTALSVGVLLLSVPFMCFIGRFSNKDSVDRIIHNAAADDAKAPWLSRLQDASSRVTTQPFAFWWGKTEGLNTPGGIDARRGWGLWVLLQCLAKGLFFIAGVPALLGLWVCRDRFRLVPGAPVLLVIGALLLVALYRVAVVVGYLSDRHTILITMVGCFWAVAGTIVIANWLTSWSGKPQSAGAWAFGMLVLLCAGPAVRTLETLHAERAGFRQAGYWLAQNARPGDRLVDPYTWASYYAGRVFQENDKEPKPAHEPRVCYIIVDETKNAHTHLSEADEAKKQTKTGREVGRWRLKRGEVAIYEVPEKTN